MRTVYIIHPARSILHYRVLTSAQDLNLKVLGIPSVNDFFTSLKNLQLRRFFNVLSDSCRWFFLKFVYLNKDIIFSLEPFNRDILKFKSLIKRHYCIYQSSWPFWNSDNYPCAATEGIKKSWRSILKKVKIVTVTKKASEEISVFIDQKYNVSVIPHAVNAKLYINNANDKPNIIFVGRFNKDKNIAFIKEIAKQLPHYHFQLIGAGPDKKLIENEKNIEIVNYIANEKILVTYFKKARILLLPSKKRKKWEELFGMAIIEAMAAGAVVIAAKGNVGPEEIIKDKKTGFLLSLKIELWTMIIKKIFKEDRLYKNISRAAFLNVKKEYDYPVVLKKWRKVLDGN